MTRYRIPSSHIPGFRVLYNLTHEQVDKIAEIIASISVGTQNEQIAEILAKESFLSNEQCSQLINVISSLIGFKLIKPEVGNEMTTEMALAFQNTEENKPDIDVNELSEKIEKILNSAKNQWLTQKALFLKREHEKIYEDNRIVTDIRVVYDESIELPIEYALIIHKLRLSFIENGEIKAAIFALDNSDLEALRISIERAQEKEKIIESTLQENLKLIKFKKP